MKRIFYLSLLLVIPFLASADHVGEFLEGRWINPYFGEQIKIKTKRNYIRVKGLPRQRGYQDFRPIRRGVFEDHFGNRLYVESQHEVDYVDRYTRDRITFLKRGFHEHHVCNSACRNGYGSYNDGYYNNHPDRNYDRNRNRNNRNRNHDRYDDRSYNGYGYNNLGINGRYFVRELDEYVVIEKTHRGLRAQRKGEKWVEFTQNEIRKNEYIDREGNKYNVRLDGSMYWTSKSGKTTFNLSK